MMQGCVGLPRYHATYTLSFISNVYIASPAPLSASAAMSTLPHCQCTAYGVGAFLRVRQTCHARYLSFILPCQWQEVYK